MGRARASMQLIQKPKTKRVTCEKRGESLRKKASELAELCDVDVCMIMYPPPAEGGSAEPPKIWPEDTGKIDKLIDLFSSVRADENRCKFSTVASYFKDRKRKTEGELDKLRKKNREARYPTSGEMFANVDEDTRRELGRNVVAKIDEVKARIADIMKMRRVPTPPPANNFSGMLGGGGFSVPASNFAAHHGIHHQHPMFHQNPAMNMIPTNSFSQLVMEAAGASTTTAVTGRYMVEQPLEQYGSGGCINGVSRGYVNANNMPVQQSYNVGYNLGPVWKPCNNVAASAPGLNGYAHTWSESFRVLAGTSTVSEFKVDKMEAPYFHI